LVKNPFAGVVQQTPAGIFFAGSRLQLMMWLVITARN
jgi:hypothetical protein